MFPTAVREVVDKGKKFVEISGMRTKERNRISRIAGPVARGPSRRDRICRISFSPLASRDRGEDYFAEQLAKRAEEIYPSYPVRLAGPRATGPGILRILFICKKLILHIVALLFFS